MSSNKRRKLEEQQPQLSAFARLRQRAAQAQAQAQAQSIEQVTPLTQEDTQAGSDLPPTESGSSSSTPKKQKSPRKKAVSASKREPSVVHADIPAGPGGPLTPRHIPEPEFQAKRGASPEKQTLTVRLSSFQPTKSNLKKKAGGEIQLKLSGGERLVILGSYGVRIVSGEVTLHGALLKASEKVHWVHAPYCYALPVLRCPDDEAVVEIESHPAAESLRGLGKLSPLFRRLWNDDSSTGTAAKAANPTFTIIFTSADAPKRVTLFDLVSPPEWNREMDNIVKASRAKPLSVMVTGPKSSGKSTFGKTLANQLLTDHAGGPKKRHANGIAVLDLDPGQPEHCIAGQVALVHITEPILGPSFCRPSSELGVRLIRAHTLASMSPDSNTKLYLEAATDLFNHYRNRLGNCPLIVNTAGWVQGTGLDLLTDLVKALRPSNLVYMAPGPMEAVERLQESFKPGSLTKLPSQTTQNAVRTAAHLRTMQAMSYFHEDTRKYGKAAQDSPWNPEPLSAVPPWQLRYAGPAPGLLGVTCYDYQAPPGLLADAINGTTVAIVEVESPLAFRTSNIHETHGLPGTDMEMEGADDKGSMRGIQGLNTITTPEGIPVLTMDDTLDPMYSQTIGLALIRGIDTENKMLQVLTPIPDEKIEEINERGGQIVLVGGRFDPPSWAYTEDLYLNASSGTGGNEEDDGDVGDLVDAKDEEGPLPLSRAMGPEARVTDATTPWIEVLRGDERRGAGFKVWRVRRDLGRTGNTGE